jgi:hypothetical protein
MSRPAQRRRPWMACALPLALCLCLGLPAARAAAEGEGAGASWRLEPVMPPTLPGVPEATTPIGLGPIGDIQFWAPNRGLLITAGNPPTIPPGVWAYDGASWHELATQCGATDGRIAWAGPEEFWTVSDGRPGQSETEGTPPLADNTLCHFSGGGIVGSYGSLAFRADSYQAMHAAGCLSTTDCWFAGDKLPEGQVGSFHLHWDGASVTATPNPQGRSVHDMAAFGRRLYESVRITPSDQISPPESAFEPADLHTIAPRGVAPTFTSLRPESSGGQSLPVYSPEELPAALDFPHLSADGEELWAAADPAESRPPESAGAEVTILHYSGGVWSQPLGPSTDPAGGSPFTKFVSRTGTPTAEEVERERENEEVNSIAAEPSGAGAWVALSSRKGSATGPVAPALLARVSSDGTVAQRQSLPSRQEELEGVGGKGAAAKIVCPALNDCWMATTQGWLFHLADEAHRHLPRDTDPAFAGLITFRPPDAGVPAVVPDAPPLDDSGLPGERPAALGPVEAPPSESLVRVPLLSRLHTRLIHGSTVELRFHLAVRARIRLLAMRGKHVLAKTPMRTFASGDRKLLLRLDPKHWPTNLSLQTHALAPLPTTSTHGVGNNSVTTSLRKLPGVLAGGETESLP